MKILVCITHVPDTTAKLRTTDGGTTLDVGGAAYIIGPYDDYALARAVELKEVEQATVTVLHVGLSEAEATLRKALAIGADNAVRINTRVEDAYQAASEIAAFLQEHPYDLVLMGKESTDYNGGQVPAMVAEMLGWPVITPVVQLGVVGSTATLTREVEGNKETLRADFPLVAGCQEPIAEWKIPTMRGIMSARKKPLEVRTPQGASAKVRFTQYEMPPPPPPGKLFRAEQVEEVVTLLKEEAGVL